MCLCERAAGVEQPDERADPMLVCDLLGVVSALQR